MHEAFGHIILGFIHIRDVADKYRVKTFGDIEIVIRRTGFGAEFIETEPDQLIGPGMIVKWPPVDLDLTPGLGRDIGQLGKLFCENRFALPDWDDMINIILRQ